MNPETGEMKELPIKSFEPKPLAEKLIHQANGNRRTEVPEGFVLLPKIGTVLNIQGCNFLVKVIDCENGLMVLRGISKLQAKAILMGSLSHNDVK